ncbi:response regulator [Aureimonas sp. SK2]|uniref:response regulator n=1 Tax=Aureimonas sp. SK2 TaxID=3015992 RepID=UPI002444FCC1|nr:response regulator [Aureimonas sp. SK2]
MFTTCAFDLLGQHVLIVEDEYFAAEALMESVRSGGGKVVGPVATVEEALALLNRGETVDAAILDVNLGGDKVFPVARALRGHAVPIVFVTGYDDWIIPQEYEDVPVFRKPADPDNVVRLLFERS